MREIAERRVNNLEKWARPSLIIVDGIGTSENI